MKKIKNISFIIIMILTFCLFSSDANALSEEERLEKLNELPYVIVDDVRQLSVNVIDPDIMLEDGRCEPDFNEYNEWISAEPMFPLTWEIWRKNNLNSCVADFYSNVLKLYFKSLDLDNNYYAYFNSENPNKNLASVVYAVDDEYSEYEVQIQYLSDANVNKFTEATSILNTMDNSYSIFGMDLINAIYHYGVSDSETTYSDNSVINRYSKIKEIVELNPSYDFATHLISGVGSPYASVYGGQIAIIEDGILYNVKDLSFYEHTIIYVDEAEEGTVFTKTEKRLKKYFNNSVDVTVDSSNSWTLDGSDLDRVINEDLEKENGPEYIGYYADITIADVETYVVIVEIPKEELDQYIFKSINKSTGIEVVTSSYDVSVDASLIVSDVTSEDYVKKVEKNENVDILKAYDISLAKISDGTFIRTIEEGIEVYMPVEDDWEKDDIQAYFIDPDGSLQQSYNGRFQEINEKEYYVFFTNHFSTYALGSRPVVNPETSDNIMNIIILGIISLLVLLGTKLYLKKIKIN